MENEDYAPTQTKTHYPNITTATAHLRTNQPRRDHHLVQAALQHYRDYIRYAKELAQANPLIQSFIERLHDQLPARDCVQRSQLPSLTYIQTSHAEIIILQAALRHYCDYVSYEQELTQAIPLIQAFMQRLHDHIPPREEPQRRFVITG
jgi:hypothetical protein